MKIKILTICAILFFLPISLQAVPVTIKITGNVTTVGGKDKGLISETIYPCVVFSGTYTYDSDAINTSTINNVGIYSFNSPYGFDISLGGYEFKTATSHTGQFEIRLVDNIFSPPFDGCTILSHENKDIFSGFFYGISWDLKDNKHTALSSIALPASAPIISDWDLNLFTIVFSDGKPSGSAPIVIEGTVTQAVLVPEPLTVILMGMGIFFLKRRK